MEQVIMMAMQTCQTYAEKSKTHVLTEYEALMFEQVCNLVAAFSKIQTSLGRAQQFEIDKALYEKQKDFDQWEKDHNEDSDFTDRDPPQGDDEPDFDGGGAGTPVQ